MSYRFKPLDELGWGVTIAISLVVIQALVTLDPSTVADWQTWTVALVGAAIRAGAGAAIDYVRRSSVPEPTLADQIMALSKTDRELLRIEIERRGTEQV